MGNLVSTAQTPDPDFVVVPGVIRESCRIIIIQSAIGALQTATLIAASSHVVNR